MKLKARIARELRFFGGLRRTLSWVKPIAPDSKTLICDDLEASVDKHRDRQAISFEGKTLTYGEMDAVANRYAHWAKEQGITRGQTVALFMPNRAEYLPIWYGLTKVGVATALINNNLTGAALAHCLNISGAHHCLVDGETCEAFEAVRDQLNKTMYQWTLGPVTGDRRDLATALKSCSSLRPDRISARDDIRAKDTALWIFTSGTTGLPKAARMTHMRVQLYMRGFAGSTGANETDRIYQVLPMYHATGGLCAMGAGLLTGGSIVLRKKFSTTHFWEDVHTQNCTMFVYIGELCRYLVNAPEAPFERDHKLRLAFGNGLRADVWEDMVKRFAIPQVLEFYGATEGNVSMFNFDGHTGAIGRIPKWLKKRFNARLVQFDIDKEEPVRGPNGLCIECGPDQVGECLGKIDPNDPRANYTGYADKAATEKKILRDVFEKGDAWFRTGDLMRQDAEGYFYFVDRIGDTFRWKGENVSTGEVADRLSDFAGVLEANVYGVAVPGQDGRAGMAALTVDDTFDLEAFYAHVESSLPTYAQPLFIRMQRQIETTGTFKYRKVDLVSDGFDPAKVKDPLYFRNPLKKAWTKMTKATFDKINEGGFRL